MLKLEEVYLYPRLLARILTSSMFGVMPLLESMEDIMMKRNNRVLFLVGLILVAAAGLLANDDTQSAQQVQRRYRCGRGDIFGREGRPTRQARLREPFEGWAKNPS
jgi:hypothetical protein